MVACFVGKYRNIEYSLFVDGRTRSELIDHAKKLARNSGIIGRVDWKVEMISGHSKKQDPGESARTQD